MKTELFLLSCNLFFLTTFFFVLFSSGSSFWERVDYLASFLAPYKKLMSCNQSCVQLMKEEMAHSFFPAKTFMSSNVQNGAD